jgi:large subunit ribosomal protein L21
MRSCTTSPRPWTSGAEDHPDHEETAVYAVIATGGKQYRVTPGQEVTVEKLAGDVGDSVQLRPVMLVDDAGAVTVDRDALASASVRASVVEQHRAPKLTVFKYKNKTGYRRRAGHRQNLTRIRVDAITP